MKTSFWNPDDIAQGILLFPKLLEAIYGRRLQKTAAVAALESFYYRLSLSQGPEDLFALQKVQTVEDVGCAKVLWTVPVFSQEAGVAMRPFQKALVGEDAQFFTDLAEAITRRSQPRHKAAIFLADYIGEQRCRLTMKGRCELVTSAEVKDAMAKAGIKGNVSRLLEELGIDLSTWPFAKIKPGRKPKRVLN